MNKSIAIIGVVVIALLVGIGLYSGESPEVRAELESFNQCLADTGTTFYGAFWCPHCIEQKKLLGNVNAIPYVECSTPDQRGQLDVCIEAEITSYPTWEFADGSRETGLQPLELLAEKTGCVLPTS